MGWEIAVTLAAVALLALLHVYAAAEEGAQVEGSRISAIAHDLAGGRDPWTRLLVFGALAAALFALGVVAVPALFGNDEESAPATKPTVTAPTTSTTPTTETATTTTPAGAPRGTILIAETGVRGSNGEVIYSYSRVGPAPVVRMVDAGVYRVLIPGLGPDARGRATLQVRANAGTDVRVRRLPGSPAFIVSTRDAATGKPAGRDFLLVVYGPPGDAHRDQERHLPKTI